MTTANKKYIPTILLIGALYLATYLNFMLFKPKVLTPLSTVKGVETERVNLTGLYPSESKEISIAKSNDGEQITLSSKKALLEIQNFYSVTLPRTGWKNTTVNTYVREDTILFLTITKPESSQEAIINLKIIYL